MSDSIAIFIDAENLTSWIKRGGLKRLESELSPYGQVIVRKAYGNWSKGNLANIQSSLNEYGFDFIHTHHPVNKKFRRHSNDSRRDGHRTQPKNQDSGPRDGRLRLFPLFRRLRELVKNIIGIGPKPPLSESVKNSCSKFIYTDSADKNCLSRSICKNSPDSAKRSFEILKSILEENSPIVLAALKLKMRERDSTFDEKKLGFHKFQDFITASGMVDIRPGEKYALTAFLSGGARPHEDSKSVLVEILKKNGWNLVSKDALSKIYDIACQKTERKSLSKSELVQEIESERLLGTTHKIIVDALNAFFKIHWTILSNDGTRTLWSIHRGESLLEEMDKEILRRLKKALQGKGVTPKIEDVQTLLYTEHGKDELMKFFSEK